MSYANNNRSEINADNISVNDSDKISDTSSGTPATDHRLHDQPIEEKDTQVGSINSSKNEEHNRRPESVNLTNFQLIKGNSMAIYYGWQIVCLIIFIFTAYETLQNVLPRSEKYPEPQKFFSRDSFILDYHQGNLGTVQSKVANSDLSFVMFYAPWSSDSQHARPVLQTISKIFYREADFMAINCWQPDGECRQQYKKVMSWPVLMAYSRNSIAIPYNGQWSETSLARFVNLMLRPLHRINKPEELLAIIHNHDAVITLFVNMETSYTFYNIFYQAAIKWLEKDPQGDVAFAVVTGKAMSSFGVDREPSLRLYLWNRTIEYEDEVWKASLIHKWLVQNKQQITHWLSPPGSRSKEFEKFIQKGPVLLLFTPRNLYDFPSDAYAMIRQIAYEYNNCDKDEWLKEMGRTYIFNQRKINIGNYHLQAKECIKFSNWKNSADNKCASFGRVSYVGLNNSTKPRLNTVNSKHRMDEYCEKIPQPYDQIYEKSKVFISTDEFPTSAIDTKNDLRSSENILNEWKDIQCKMINLSNKLRAKTFEDPILKEAGNSSQIKFDQITGFACKNNKTLSFLAMDSLNYGIIAEKLGTPLNSVTQSTGAIIIDSQDESSYLLNETLTTPNLIDFVYNYTTKKLARHLRHSGKPRHSHFYRPANYQSEENYHPSVEQTTRKLEPIAITTISSENFSNFISDPDRTVAILFTSSQCAFCTIFSSTLLTLSKILALDHADYLKIARIDSDKNDLPWQYEFETLPAFIIFNDKLDSRKYPMSMQVTVQNVLGFILSNLNRPNRLKAFASILKYRNQQKQSIESVIVVLRRETEDNIIDSLRDWRSNPRRRNYTLRRIQALRRLYFSLYNQTYNRDLKKLDELIKDVLVVWLHKADAK